MKKTRSFSLEEDVLEIIDNYKLKYNLSSSSSALERILLVELAKKDDSELIKDIKNEVEELKELKEMIKDLKSNGIVSYKAENLEEESVDEEVEDDEEYNLKNSSIEDSFKNSLNSMPD